MSAESQFAPEETNLLLIVVVFLIVAWVARLCRAALHLSELNIALHNDQVIRFDGFATEFSEMPLFSRAQFEQLLRSKQLSPGMDVRVVKAAVHIRKATVKTKVPEGKADDVLSVSFQFDTMVPATIQLFWGVQISALLKKIRQEQSDARDDLLAPRHGDPSGMVLPETSKGEAQAGEKGAPAAQTQKRWFGGASSSAAAPAGSDFDPSHPALQDYLDADSYVFKSELTRHPAGVGQSYETPGTSRVSTSMEGLDLTFNDESVRYPLIVVIRGLQAPEDDGPFLFSTTQLNTVTFDSGSPPGASVTKQLVLSNAGLFEETLDLYGADDPDATECVVCLSEPKQITLLPCRHCCTCNSCFRQLEKCPVCRSPIASYIKFRDPNTLEPPDDEAASAVAAAVATTPATGTELNV